MVTEGTLARTAVLTGETRALRYASIAAPVMRGPDSGRQLVLIHLAPGGSFVKKGDMVAQIDAQSLKDHIDDIHSQVQQADADITKRKAEQAIDWENLQQTVRNAKAAWDKANLDASASEIRTVIDTELLKLAVEEAEAYYKQVKQELKIKQDAFAAEIRILELTRDRHSRHRDRHRVDLERFTMYAPMDGIIVMLSTWRGQMAQIEMGDEVRPGQPFMRIVDPGYMQVDATVSQAGSEGLRLGQEAAIRFDAFPDLELPGTVTGIGAIATSGGRQQYYVRRLPVQVRINGIDRRVIPDLSTRAEVVLEKVDHARIVPIEAISLDNSRHFVNVWAAGKVERRQVVLGLTNATHAQITTGLDAGETVLLGDTAPPPVTD